MILNDYLKENGIDFPYTTEYSEEYLNNAETIKIIMRNKYGTLPLKNSIAETSALIMATLFQYKYKLDKLWETTKLEYNPIWNVEGTETTITEYGTHETTRSFGEKVSESVYGEKIRNNTYSSYPYDTLTETPTNKENVIDSENTDIFTDSPHNDTTTSNEHTDTVTISREGNIGVTSTQHLIGEERSVANFSFWNVVIEMLAKEITIPYYQERGNEYEYCFW
jgi:hypothetical protein